MKIAIHHTKGSFSDRWIEYCQNNRIAYKIVNAYASNIILQLKDCNAFMWHFSQLDYRDMLFVRQLLYSVKKMGLKVFPDFDTAWHFDDKVGQKYLLEAVGAPLVPSYVFYTKKEALEWIQHVTFPKIFKLRGGAGSSNVLLVKTKSQAISLIQKAFGRGFAARNKLTYSKELIRIFKLKGNLINLAKALGIWILPSKYNPPKLFIKMSNREKGYVYFQDFIPNNAFDIRIVVIGEKAFALKRLTRKNDFRASGSGNILYAKAEIDERCVEISFKVNRSIQSQSLALDFVFDKDNTPLIIEMSYGFAVNPYDACPGYWDSNMNWHERQFNPQYWMVEDLISD